MDEPKIDGSTICWECSEEVIDSECRMCTETENISKETNLCVNCTYAAERSNLCLKCHTNDKSFNSKYCNSCLDDLAFKEEEYNHQFTGENSEEYRGRDHKDHNPDDQIWKLD